MKDLFLTVVDMSLTGSLVILCVLAVRLLLKRAPKIFSYALWAVVLFRLLCPVSLSARFSVLDWTDAAVEQTQTQGITSTVSYIPAEYVTVQPAEAVQEVLVAEETPVETKAETRMDRLTILAAVWVMGMGIMVLYSAVTYAQLRRRLVGAVPYVQRTWLADHIDSPFVMGLLTPRIYLPSSVPEGQRAFIIAHERHHIRRGDHIVKFLAYAALCIHWFNPLVWVAFLQAGKDMEMSCDEAVIRKLGQHIRADYSAALLHLATGRKIIGGTPLAFGEGDTKGRILNMAKWKKPKVWVSVLCVVVCIGILVFCAVNPEKEQDVGEMTRMEGPCSIGYGDLHYELPEGYTVELVEAEGFTDEELKRVLNGEANRNMYVSLTKRDGILIGGVQDCVLPEGDPWESEEWVQELGLWRQEDGPIAYMMSGSSGCGDYTLHFFSDVPEGQEVTVNQIHTFFLSEDQTRVFDMWFDMTVATQREVDRFVGSAYVGSVQPESIREAAAEEAEALEKCRAVLDMVQSGSCEIALERENYGTEVLNSSSSTTFYQNGEDWVSITEIPEDGGPSIHAYMYADGVHYNNEANAWDENGDPYWEERSAVEVCKAWLAVFQWDTNKVTYMDTLVDEDGECVMLRIDEPYLFGTNNQEFYFVNFNFDASGNFLNIKKQVNLYEANWFVEYESIVSLAPENVAAEINRQYYRATGKNLGTVSGVQNSAAYQEEFQSNDGSVTFRVNASLPEETALPTIDVVPHSLTGEEVEHAAYVLFGEEAVFYEQEPTLTRNLQLSKAEIQSVLERYAPYTDVKALMDLEGITPEMEEENGGYMTEVAQMVADFLAEYTEKLETAPVENPRPLCDFTFKNYAYYVCDADDPDFTIWHDEAIEARVEVEGIPYTILARRQDTDYKENCISVYIHDYDSPYSMDSSYFRSQLCRTAEPTEVQINAVQDRTREILSGMDLGQWQIDKCEVSVQGLDGLAEEYSIKVYAVPVLNGIPALRRGTTGIQDNETDNFLLTDACFEFSPDGVLLAMELYSPIEVISTSDGSVQTLPMETLLEMAKANLQKKTAGDYSIYRFPEMDGMELECSVAVSQMKSGLTRIRVEGTEDTYRYVPCVSFLGTAECTNLGSGMVMSDAEHLQTLVILNAVDGSVVEGK